MPGLVEAHTGILPGTPAWAVTLVVAVGAAAVLGQTLMLLLARAVRDSVRVPAARAVDSALGLVAVLVTSVLVLWVVALGVLLVFAALLNGVATRRYGGST